jgi:hypothetical protein
MNSASQRHCTAFKDLVEQFLTSLLGVFPNCFNTSSILDQFKSCTPEDIELQMEEWNIKLGAYYGVLRKKDSTDPQFSAALRSMNFGVFQYIDLPGKWNNTEVMTAENKDIVLEFLNEINMIVQVHSSIPKALQNSMNGLMENMFSSLIPADGSAPDLSNLNFMDMTQKIMTSMTNENMEELHKSLPQMLDSLQGILRNPEMAEMMNGLTQNMPFNPISMLDQLNGNVQKK